MKTIKTIKDIKKKQLKVLIKHFINEERKSNKVFIKFYIEGNSELYHYVLANGLIYYGNQNAENFNTKITIDTDDYFLIKLFEDNFSKCIIMRDSFRTRLEDILNKTFRLFEGLEG